MSYTSIFSKSNKIDPLIGYQPDASKSIAIGFNAQLGQQRSNIGLRRFGYGGEHGTQVDDISTFIEGNP